MQLFPENISSQNADLNPLLQGHALDGEITALHPQLAAVYADTQVIRDVMGGSRSVKRRTEVYLPKSRNDQDDREYQRILEHSVFFPATRRTAESKKGLMFARNVAMACATLEPIKAAITNELASVDDMAENVVWETLQTNFTGLLIDHPSPPGGVVPTAQDAVAQNYRPFIHVFPFETILWIDYHFVQGARRPCRVVLRETHDQCLELVLAGGQYQQRVWRDVEGAGYGVVQTTTPIRNGRPLDRIPFVVVSDNTKPWPQPSVLRDVAELNLDHFRANSRISNLALYGSAVVPFMTGVKLTPDPDTGLPANPNINIATGGVVVLEEATAQAGFMEPHGHMATALAAQAEVISEMMVKVGSRVLSSDKGAPEDATVVAMRNLAEDSATASLAKVYGARISEALTWCAWWMGSDQPAKYTLNTDYSNARPDAPTIVALQAAVQAGLLDEQNFYMFLRDGGVVNRLDTFEASQARIEQDAADRPPVDPPAPAEPAGDA